jgi:hypothetical protein
MGPSGLANAAFNFKPFHCPGAPKQLGRTISGRMDTIEHLKERSFKEMKKGVIQSAA